MSTTLQNTTLSYILKFLLHYTPLSYFFLYFPKMSYNILQLGFHHSKKFILTVFHFFNHGEGKSIQNKPIWSIQEVTVSKFSSIMVKVKAIQTSHFRTFKMLKFSPTMVKIKAIHTSHYRAFKMLQFQNFLQPW